MPYYPNPYSQDIFNMSLSGIDPTKNTNWGNMQSTMRNQLLSGDSSNTSNWFDSLSKWGEKGAGIGGTLTDLFKAYGAISQILGFGNDPYSKYNKQMQDMMNWQKGFAEKQYGQQLAYNEQRRQDINNSRRTADPNHYQMNWA